MKVKPLAYWLKGYKFSHYLIKGFSNGFRLGHTGDRISFHTGNLKSCQELPEIVQEKLNKELQCKRIAGPLTEPPFDPFCVSPIGLVPKREPNSYRLIHHLSYPDGASINDNIDPDLATVQYSSFDQAVEKVRFLGQGCYMAKTDIESAFRIIPIHPLDYQLLGFHFKGLFYYDRCLPMGASSSCSIFNCFSSALKWIAQSKLAIHHIIHILDDFLILEKSKNKCGTDLRVFLDLCKALGDPIKHNKTVTATNKITFMGLEIDSTLMEARLPNEKLAKLRSLLNTYKGKRKIKLKELQSLLGLLNFCCQVVWPGRAFLRRLTDLTKGITKPHHRVTLSKEGRRDIEAWHLFAEYFNGKHILLDQRWLTSQSLHLYTDASGSVGYGAILDTHWFYGSWSDQFIVYQITYKELFPIVLAIEIWGTKLTNKCILLHSDNNAVVHIINKQTCKDKDIMFLVRRLVLACMKWNILIRSEHVQGKQNDLADMLSRLQIAQLRQKAHWVDSDPTIVPSQLLKHR